MRSAQLFDAADGSARDQCASTISIADHQLRVVVGRVRVATLVGGTAAPTVVTSWDADLFHAAAHEFSGGVGNRGSYFLRTGLIRPGR